MLPKGIPTGFLHDKVFIRSYFPNCSELLPQKDFLCWGEMLLILVDKWYAISKTNYLKDLIGIYIKY